MGQQSEDVDPVRVEATAYTVTRLPDSTADYSVWSVKVEAAGHSRWAVRHLGSCLNKQGEWEHEPLPSSREDWWLDTVRWEHVDDAIEAAKAAEAVLVVNGLTSADVLARHIGRTEDRA